jgi:hypothetical protein
VTPGDDVADASAEKRSRVLSLLLGMPETDCYDQTLTGRLAIIAKLKAARRGEIARGQSGSWLYDVNRHLNICAALRLEYRALASFFSQAAMDVPPRTALCTCGGRGSRV